ncbi:extended synaptotagmin-1-like isoform X3 [Physella acuta]|uniref:extended synaptotagmin-1-like isoform X3 n=1 Tax=Physella acuta TaxID=109671 RepID=UPI0027DEA9AD|nr:extended synaptotagmin-1-like isoform X3 [Physella acuta]
MPKKNSSKHKEPRKTVVEDTLLMKVVQKYFKLAGVVSAVWLVGYFKFSVSWLWLLLVFYVWKERQNKSNEHRICISQQLATDEKSVILARVEDLPSWVNFPDVERAEWINKILSQMWPYIGEYVEKILRENVEQSIRASLPAAMQSFKFSKIDLGDIPPRIGGLKVYSQLRRDEIYMDLELNYSSDSNIAVSVKGINAGIKDLTIHGTLRVVMKPLINKMPLVGGVLVFFLKNPELNFDLTNLANAFDLPGLSDMLHSIIQEQIANFMVLPNRFPIKLAEDLDLNKLRYPQPEGVVRVKILEAKDLKKADIGITGKGKSDPYVIIKVGPKEMKTKVIGNSVAPVWNESFEMTVDSADGQLLYLEVFDEDPGKTDDELGRVSFDLSKLQDKGFEDEWLPLEDVKQGMIHVQLTWLWLANDPLELDRCDKLSFRHLGWVGSCTSYRLGSRI